MTRREEYESYINTLKELPDNKLRQELREAGEAYEFYGGYWTLAPVYEEMKRRGLLGSVA